jgi:Septum formation
VPARLALGRALEASGRPAEAATVYAEAARISPFSPGVSKSLRRVWVAPLAGFSIVAALMWGTFRVVGRQFDQRTVLFGLLISATVLIVGTLLLLFRQRRRFASLSEDDRRLLEVHSRTGLLIGPASGRLVLVGMVIVLLSGAAVMFAMGTKPSLGMKVGDCFTLDSRTSIEQISAIPCDLPHGTEIYATVEDPAPSDAPYPGVETVRAGAEAGCEVAYQQFFGVPYSRSARLHIFILSPEAPYWDIGVRTNWCSLQDPKGRQTSGSAKGSGG